MERGDYFGKKILVVDDDRDITTAICEYLKSEFVGVEISKAFDGKTAERMALRDEPDVIVLDAMLPLKSGFLVLEKIKARKPSGSKPYVVVITGNKGRRYLECAESFGADDFINKPFRMERLVSSVGEGLEKFAS